MKDSIFSKPNVKRVRDAQGKYWICDVDVEGFEDFSAEGCVRETEWLYDRMFGG
jgi:hypothetical protein